MKVKFLILLLMLPFLLLSACGADESGAAENNESIEPIAVEILTPGQIEAEQPVLLSAVVKQGEETVEDADDVTFEVWESGNRKEAEMIKAEHTANGIYEAERKFKEGLYFVQAHTSARMMHAMPKKEVKAGNPDPATIVPDNSDDSEGMKNIDGHSGH